MPKISVIIPSYNHAPFIGEAIQSVLDQTFQDFEILIIDDASHDNSVEVITSFIDPRIKCYINEKNMGANFSVNKLIKLASGEYIALLNSDDLWETDKLAKQIEFMEYNKQYGAVFSNAQVINQDGSAFQNQEHFYTTIFEQSNRSRFEWLNYFFNIGNCLCHPSMLIRKSVYDDVGLYNPLMASLPDFEMWVRVCLKYEIYVMPEKLVQFRILDNEQNASGANPEHIIRYQFENKKILDHFLFLSEADYQQVFGEFVTIHPHFSLAFKAIEKHQQFMKAWGLDILYEFLCSNPNSMEPNEFTKLTAKHDIFNVYTTQLFLDFGDGISEENSIKLPVPVVQNSEVQEFVFDLTDRPALTNLRFDPLNESCVIEIEELSLITDYGKLDLCELITSNAMKQHGKSHFFDLQDPQIYFEGLSSDELRGASKLVARICYVHRARDAVHVCTNQLAIDKNTNIISLENEIQQNNEEINALKDRILSLESILATQERIIISLKNEIIQYANSYSWQITKPLRKIKQILKGN